MIDTGVVTGSGTYESAGDPERHLAGSAVCETKVAVTRVGPWLVGSISRHQRDHDRLPHTIPHQTNLTALKQLDVRAILGTSVVGAVDPGTTLGRPILFDDLFFPGHLPPKGEACTTFAVPGGPGRGQPTRTEPFSPPLRRRLELAAGNLRPPGFRDGIYGHTNGPRFENPGGGSPVDRDRDDGREPGVWPRGRSRREVGACLRARWPPGEPGDRGRGVRDEVRVGPPARALIRSPARAYRVDGTTG